MDDTDVEGVRVMADYIIVINGNNRLIAFDSDVLFKYWRGAGTPFCFLG